MSNKQLDRNSSTEEIIEEIKDAIGDDKFSSLREEEVSVMIDDIQHPAPPIEQQVINTGSAYTVNED